MAAKKNVPAAPAKREVAVPTNTDLAMFAAHGGTGFDEGIDAGAYALPFLSILQGLSPAVQRGTPEYIEGAAPGMIINTVTKQLFDEVFVSVVRRTHTLCRWNSRDAGGGFLGEQEAHIAAMQAFGMLPRDDKGRSIDSEGKEVTEHRNFYCQVLHEEGHQEPALISMSRSQLKHARNWNTLIGLKSAKGANGQPVSTSEIWRLTTQLQKNKKGEQWYGWAVAHYDRHSDAAVFAQVTEAVTFAKSQSNVQRQLEHIEEPATGDM